MRRRLAAMAAAVVVAAEVLRAQAVAQPEPAFQRVRPVDNWARELLLDAWQSSPTVRQLIQALEGSDLIVQVESQRDPAAFRGRLRFISAAQGCRYLRVSVRMPALRKDSLPALAHELQHAVEIANAPDVRDEQAVEALLHRIGWEWRHTVFETAAALETEERVRLEITVAARRQP